MTSRAHPLPQHLPSEVDFSTALQNLVAEFWDVAEAEGRVTDEPSTVHFLEYIFGSLAHELGRIDGVARLHGVARDQMLAVLARAYAGGKSSTLENHHQESQGCTCEASLLLKKELELH